MDCRSPDREELLEKYLHHRLDEPAQDELELHILSCQQCARQIEILQVVHADLSGRAHEIRSLTPARPLWLRWQPLVAAPLLLVAVVVVSVVWKIRVAGHTSPETIASSAVIHSASVTPSAAGPVEAPAIAQAPAHPSQVPDRGVTRPNSVKKDDSAPPSVPPSPSINQLGESSAPPAPDEAAPTARDGEAYAARTLNARPSEGGFQAKLTTAQGVEWYRLGAVEAPPYTFSGLGSTREPPDSGNGSSYSSRGAPADAGRVPFQDAMRAYLDGRYGEAIGGLTVAVKLEPTAPDINFYLGVCNLLEGQPEDSVAPLQTAAADNSPLQQSSLYFLAKAYIQSGKLAEAEAELNRAIAVPGRLTKDASVLLVRLRAFRKQIETQ
jgi:TolA-binding protein